MNQVSRVFAELARIADYDEAAQQIYRRLRGGTQMDNRMNAAERFVDERQYEAMRTVARARLQREASQGSDDGAGQAGGLARLVNAFRRALQREAPQRIPARVEIRRS